MGIKYLSWLLGREQLQLNRSTTVELRLRRVHFVRALKGPAPVICFEHASRSQVEGVGKHRVARTRPNRCWTFGPDRIDVEVLMVQ